MHIDKVVATKEASTKIRSGVKKLSDAVSQTLGPYGVNGLMEKGLRITNDGISIAKEIQLEDEIEDLALRKAREASVKANEKGGDGSTTTILLTHKILESVSEATGTGAIKKRPTVDVLSQINREKETVEAALKDMATPIESVEQLIDSATVSVEDKELGTLIGQAQWELGPEGVLIAEISNNPTTTVERVPGIRIDNGLSAMQVINNPEKEALEVFDIPTILTAHTVNSLEHFLPLITTLSQKGDRKLVIMARAFSEGAIREIMEAHKNNFAIFPINAPYINQREVMKDLAAVLGGRFLDTEDSTLDSLVFSDLGRAKQITAKRWEAIFVGNEDTVGRTEKRHETLAQELKASPSDFERKAIHTRMAQLKNGFGLVKVGAVSDTERARIFDKVEDAVNATKAALQEGTVKGAGLAFKEIAEMEGIELLKQPLLSIHEQIRANAPSDFVVEDWVRDPVLVLRSALEQACSVAGDLATVGVAVHTKWIREEESN